MRNRTLSSIFVGALMVTACTTPMLPPKELVDARLALQDAKSSNADKRVARTYDSAAANLDVANKSWEKDHDAAAILHQARLAEAEARKAQFTAEAQIAEETLSREHDRKNRNAIALRDAEIVMLRQKGQEAEIGRMKATAQEQEQALQNAKDKLAAEQARSEEEAARFRQERETFSAQEAERVRAEREADRLRHKEELLAAAEAERLRTEEEADRLREEHRKIAALAIERARAEQAERDLERLRAEHEQSRAELTATLSRLAQVREEDRGVVVTLPGNIFFNVNKADVKPGMQQQLRTIAKALTDVPDQYLLIEGHTDSDGSSEYNLSLSEARARSVERILLGGGVAPERMETKGFGESKPIADNRTAAGKAQNRRVEIVLMPTRP